MALSSLQLNAGAGLLQNTGLVANTLFTAALGSYTALPFVSAIDTTISVGATGNILTTGTLANLETIATGVCPALGDSLPYANLSITDTAFSPRLLITANTYLGNGDYTRFSQVYSQATGYISQSNELITSSGASQDYMGPTFLDMNALITGGASEVTTDIPAFAADLANLGVLINLADLENWGTPLNFVQQLVAQTGLVPPPLQVAFVAVGIDHVIVESLTDPAVSVTDTIQKIMWSAMTQINGDALAQVLQILKVKTANISTVADLLNPLKIFPTSYQSLQVPYVGGYEPIYVDGSGTVNSNIIKTLPGYAVRATDPGYLMTSVDRMSVMTQDDLAVANKSLALGMLQINGVINLTLPQLADTLSKINTTTQPLVNSLSQPVPNSVAQFYSSSLSPGGTGPGNTVVISDILGTAAGINFTTPYSSTVEVLAQVNTSYLTTVYQSMANVVLGTYGTAPVVIPSGPGAGNYANQDTAIQSGLIPVAQTEIALIATVYPNEVANLNQFWSTMGNQVVRETTLQSLATIDFTATSANNRQSMMSFISSLPEAGTDSATGGSRELLTSIADTTTLAGQSIIACLQQGVNETALQTSGIQTGVNIP